METSESLASETGFPSGSENVLYTANTHTTGGLEGASRSSDSRLDIKLSAPGGAGKGTNPEQLFAAAWSACFIESLGIVARQNKIILSSNASINTEIDLCKADNEHFFQVRLYISLPDLDARIAQSLVELAKLTCPYSKATEQTIKTEYHLI